MYAKRGTSEAMTSIIRATVTRAHGEQPPSSYSYVDDDADGSDEVEVER